MSLMQMCPYFSGVLKEGFHCTLFYYSNISLLQAHLHGECADLQPLLTHTHSLVVVYVVGKM